MSIWLTLAARSVSSTVTANASSKGSSSGMVEKP